MAITVAMAMVALVVAAGMVLDFGLVRLDRQTNKAAADAATMAGLLDLDGGTDAILPFKGACTALAYLRQNHPELRDGGLTGTWSNGAGASIADPCTTPPTSIVCKPDDPTTWAVYRGIHANPDITVEIKAGYKLSDGGFPEESMASLSGDASLMGGCDQLAVIVQEVRRPGLGSLATSSDLVTRVRSVGRVDIVPGEQAPALLLLDRNHCRVVQIGASGGGADSKIHVYGAKAFQQVRADGTPGDVFQPGSIHADTDASECSGGNPSPPVLLGKSSNGIVAFAAPDSSSSGLITSYAALNGASAATVSDGLSNVYGSQSPTALLPGEPPKPRPLVTRHLVDMRYLEGVRTAVSGANAVFSTVASGSVPSGFVQMSNCAPTTADFAARGVDSTTSLLIDCTGNPGFKGVDPIPASEVIFNGQISSSAKVSLPNAKKVYVQGTGGDAIDASNGFSMHTAGRLVTNPAPLGPAQICTSLPTPGKAIMFVKDGGIKDNNGLFQLCNTTVIMMGGDSAACLPTLNPTKEPTTTPCSTGAGNGRLKIAGTATQDWTAPNEFDDMTMKTDAEREALWQSPDGMEDLALWSESYGTASDWQMSGGGLMHLVGVFMTPNAAPFTVKGNGGQDLNNAQYIATSFEVNGGATLRMTVDPNNGITLPEMNFNLVR